jgi:hypothetical protein
VAAGEQLGHAQRGLVGFGAGGQQQRLLQRGRQRRGQRAGQVDDRAAEHAAEQVVQRARGVADRRHHVGVTVAEDRAHLSRGEVEDRPPVGVVDVGALGTLDHGRHPRAAVTDQMGVGVGPEVAVVAHAWQSATR